MGEVEEVTGEDCINWIETNCHVPDGKDVGKPVKLREWQKDIIRGIYDSPTRRAIISFGRKNAKTTLSAFLLLLHLVGPKHRVNSQLYSAAQSRDQAAILFALAAKIVRMSKDLSQYVIVRDSQKQLYCQELGTIYKALSAEVSTSYGLSSVFTVHDELGQAKGPHSELYEALETSSGAHENPLSIVISTQAPTDGDLMSILIDDAKAGHDPKTKLWLYTADEEIDPFSEGAIIQANPAYGDFLNKDEILDKANTAKRMPSSEASYRNLVLNQRVEAADPFVTKRIWEQNKTKPESYEGCDVYGGLDLSTARDLTSLTLMNYRESAWDVHPTFWLPYEGLREKSKADRVPYDVWAKQGYLQTCPGPSVEYEHVAKFMRGVFDRCNVKAIAFDRWGMKHLIPWLEKAGFNESELELFVPFGQGFQSMSPALRDLESLLLTSGLRHGGHPILNMCMMNARVQTDPAGNRKFTKQKSSGRIDGAVTLAMAAGTIPDAPQAEYITGTITAL